MTLGSGRVKQSHEFLWAFFLILRKHLCDRQRFRKLRPSEGEFPQELITRLKGLATRWARDSKTRGDLLDLIVREQFLSVLPEDSRIAVIERQPKTLEDAGRVANNFLQARSFSISKRGKKPVTLANECPRCGRPGHWAKDYPSPRTREQSGGEPKNDHRQTTSRGPGTQYCDIAAVKCFNCNERGHYASFILYYHPAIPTSPFIL